MKYKKFVIFLFSAIIIFITYNNLKKEEINYLALGDGLAKGITPFETSGKSYSDYLFTYLNNKTETNKNYKAFTKEDYRITDLINDIENIRIDKKDNITITNVIKKADIITISIGSEELFYKLKQHEATVDKNNKLIIIKYIDEMFEDMHKLLSIIRNITNSHIIIIGYYNPLKDTNTTIDSIYNYLDLKFKELLDDKMYYINIYNKFKYNSNYLPNKHISYPTLEGYNYIANEIISIIESEKLLKNKY